MRFLLVGCVFGFVDQVCLLFMICVLTEHLTFCVVLLVYTDDTSVCLHVCAQHVTKHVPHAAFVYVCVCVCVFSSDLVF